MDFKTVQVCQCLILEECPDSVEFCPGKNVLACGTYQLLEQDSESTPGHLMNRKGSLMLFSVENDGLEKISSTKTEAILDCKWRKDTLDSGDRILCSADAKGKAVFYQLQNSNDTYFLSEISKVNVTADGLLLSLDWSKNSSTICASDSNGCLSIMKLCPDGKSTNEHRFKAHDYEAWITAFNHWDENVIFSGGDDCKFCGWDVRTQTSVFKNSTHGAGVCSIQCNPKVEHMVATGSYDEIIRLWDCRAIRRRPLSEFTVNGGIWRIKFRDEEILTACMFNGFKVLKYEDGSICEQYSFNSNDGSLAYGVDWCNSDLIAGCTFYDRRLGLWNLPPR